jgi:hypothetical protein
MENETQRINLGKLARKQVQHYSRANGFLPKAVPIFEVARTFSPRVGVLSTHGLKIRATSARKLGHDCLATKFSRLAWAVHRPAAGVYRRRDKGAKAVAHSRGCLPVNTSDNFQATFWLRTRPQFKRGARLPVLPIVAEEREICHLKRGDVGALGKKLAQHGYLSRR